MTHALLVSEQHVDQLSFTSSPSTWARQDEPLQQGPSYGFAPAVLEMDYQRHDSPRTWISLRLNPIKRSSHHNRPNEARHALEQISALRRTRQMQRQVHEEAAWIAANRARFAGRWIALVGANLLAVGDSAREVFQATAQNIPTPLIIRVDQEALPFAGW